jgi:hypothetical protein
MTLQEPLRHHIARLFILLIYLAGGKLAAALIGQRLNFIIAEN